MTQEEITLGLHVYELLNCRTGEVIEYVTGYTQVHNCIVKDLMSGGKIRWDYRHRKIKRDELPESPSAPVA